MLDQNYYRRVETEQPTKWKNRHLKLSGAKNLRDLGGYRTVDGRVVRWGILYRSDGLSKLTRKDLARLSALALDRIIDLRAPVERELKPDRLPAEPSIHLVEIPILDSTTNVWHEAAEEVEKNFNSDDSLRYLLDTNRELATKFTPEIRQFLREVSSANGRPLLFHCAAGKDRTGFAAAVLLRILGVPQEVVMEDYMLTNQYFLASHRWSLVLMFLLKGNRFMSMVKTFMEANPAYLNAAFEAIDRDHGSFDTYVSNGLGLSQKEIEHLRDIYLV